MRVDVEQGWGISCLVNKRWKEAESDLGLAARFGPAKTHSFLLELSSPDMAAYSVSPYIQRQYLYRSDIDGECKLDDSLYY